MEEINKYWDDDLNDLVDLTKRPIPEEQKRKFEGYAAEILSTLGMDLSSPSTCDTPRQVHPGVDRCHRRVRWGSQAAENLPYRMPWRTGLPV